MVGVVSFFTKLDGYKPAWPQFWEFCIMTTSQALRFVTDLLEAELEESERIRLPFHGTVQGRVWGWEHYRGPRLTLV
jgi:hypothetical protein